MKKCKSCNEKFEPRFSTLEKYCWNSDCKLIEAMQKLEKIKSNNEKKERLEWRERAKKMDVEVNSSKYKKTLQDEINKLARMIDNRFGLLCIDCGKKYGKQQDAGHFKSVGSNASIRYNLHNIHSQKSDCNQNGLGGGRERQYYDGLIERYGKEYAEFVDLELQQKFPYIGLMNHEYPAKIKLVRSIIKNFDTYLLENPSQAREIFNKLIGIYK